MAPPAAAQLPEASLAAEAHRILSSHHHDKIDSLTRGRSTAFAASHVELYMRPHGGAMPAVDEVGRGDVKTPPLWHTAAKMPAGRWYSDGSFHGEIPLMASSMELEKDRSFDALVGVVIPRIKQEFDDVIRHLRPPPYPYAIDRHSPSRARRCSIRSRRVRACHGVYDGKGNVEWPGVHRDVGTDRSRLDVVSPGFVDAFNASPTRRARRARSRAIGYAATPLTGVWANFPYLHNGSVPTLHHLLGPVVRAAGDLRSHGVAHRSIASASASRCSSIATSREPPRRSCSAASAAIATGSTRAAQARATRDTTCGR